MERQNRPGVGASDPRETRGFGATPLRERLERLEGFPYGAYRDLRGRHDLGASELEILHVQPDPFAPPSRIRLSVPAAACGLRASALSAEGLLATEDYFARAVHDWLERRSDAASIVRIDPPAQAVLRRTALRLVGERMELLLTVELPARGRRIEGRRAARALTSDLPRMIREVLLAGSWDASALERHRRCAEDHHALLGALEVRGWVAFVADGAILPRRSGEDDAPLAIGAVPFRAPDEMAAEIDLPHAGRLRGLAIPRGITLLCGGGFHGKSTLLRALAVGVYPHVPGDGRERVATDPTAMMVRAEDGRAVTGIDLRAFLHDLPGPSGAGSFTTENASGSTSQAAAILEAIEAGSRCLLIDEDSSATNFLLRDPWMAKLLRSDQEPIVPLFARLREIHERFGVSAILVAGGSGEAFRVADRVILMDRYRPSDATARAATIREQMPPGIEPPPAAWPEAPRRLPIERLRGRGGRIKALGARKVLLGRSEIDLGASGALVHPSQARSLAGFLARLLESEENRPPLPDIVESWTARIARAGPAAVWDFPRGDLAEVRAQELAMLLSRLRYAARRGEPGTLEEGTPRGV